MNKTLLSGLTILIVINLMQAQITSETKIFSNTHGIKQEGATFYEVEGYSITVYNEKSTFDEKGFRKFKKKCFIDKDVMPSMDSSFQMNRVFLKTSVRTDNVSEIAVYYMFPNGKRETKVIGLQTIIRRDKDLEKFLVKSIINESVPTSVYTSMAIDSINFAGRFIQLGPACSWMKPHSIQCPYMGQMNWAEFRNQEKAQEMVDAQLDITKNKSTGELLQNDTISILFEGTETKAIRIVYKIKIPQLIMGGSNILIAYYVKAEVRGKHISCVLSHYSDDGSASHLPPLLNEVMKLK